MKKLVHSFLVMLLAAGTTWAQEHQFCGTDQIFHQMVQEDPSLAKDLKRLIANAQVEKAGDDETIYVIPVVFHILHQYGPENIPDANVVDAIDYMNLQYRKLNADTAQLIPAFQNLIADAKIQFKLAAYDPWGNCTNGINRIYTHETNKGNAESKLQQWDRSKYLNIWVVKAIQSGAAGYSHYPVAVNGQNYFMDGIVILYDYVGRLSPSQSFRAHALGHEAAHWLAIPHVWGSTNEPGVACGDEGIEDTPITKGYNYCPSNPEASKICDTTVYENYQNFMDYSYCSHMFTPGQVAVMRHSLNSSDALRNNLITPATQESTGVTLDPKPLCVPTVDISASTRFTCVGENVQFFDRSFNAPVVTREWSFQDGSPATSTASNPTVSFTSWGTKKVTLKVTNAAGEAVGTFDQYIDVQPDWSFVGPKGFNMESTDYQQLRFLNDGDTYSSFSRAGVGYNSASSMKLTNYKNISSALSGTEESRYYMNLNGQVDAIITPPVDLRNTSSVSFSFNYSYATNAVQSTEMTEKIKVYYSRDCGKTWISLGTPTQSTIEKSALATAGFAGNIDFAPTSVNDWGFYTRNFNVTSQDSRTRFKIEFNASSYSSNLYIDNININGTLGLADEFGAEHDLTIAPNPVQVGNDLMIEYTAKNEPVTFTLRNLQGEEIVSIVRNDLNQEVSFGLPISQSIAAAYYFLEVKSASSTTVRKIAVIK